MASRTSTPVATAQPTGIWPALVLIYFTWGSLYLAIRLVVDEASPMASMALRFLLAGMIMTAAVVHRTGFRTLRVTGRELLGCLFLGSLLLGIGNGLNALGQSFGVPSGVTALLCATVPLFISLFRLVGGDRPHPLGLLGIAVGLGGVGYLVFGDGAFPDKVPVLGVLAVLGAAFGWALGSVLQARTWRPVDVWVGTSYQLYGAAICLVLLSLARHERPDLSMGPKAWVALMYLVLIGSVVSFTVYQWLLEHAPLGWVATHTYDNPVVAVALGAAVLSEPTGPALFVGGAAVVVSVVLTVVAETRLHARDHTGAEVT